MRLRDWVFGTGSLPDQLRAEVVADGPVLLDEGLSGSVTRRHYRAPGYGYANWERHGVLGAGAVAITTRRLVVWCQGGRFVDIPLARPWPPGVTVCASRAGEVTFGYDAVRYARASTGTVELRLRTPRAAEIVELLGVGAIEERLRAELASDGLRFLAERLPGTITYRDLRVATRHIPRRIEVTTAAVALTAGRMVVHTGHAPHVDVAVVKGRPVAVTVRRVRDRVVIGYDAHAFHDDRSGHVEIRLATGGRAAELVGLTSG